MKTLKFVFKKETGVFSNEELNYFITEKLNDLKDFKKFLNEKFDEDLYIIIEKIIPVLFVLSNSKSFKELEIIIKNENLFFKKVDNEIVIETQLNKVNIYISGDRKEIVFIIRDISNCDFFDKDIEEKVLKI